MPGHSVSRVLQGLARKCKIDTRAIEDAYPCTSLQAALVAASLHDSGRYVSRFVFDVSDIGVEPSTIQFSSEAVYSLNPILRTRVVENGGEFLQIVTKTPLTWIEGKDLQQYLAQDRLQPVSLGEPLARFGWVAETNGKQYMIWSLHHCQYDEWSFGLLVEDLNNNLRGHSLHGPPRTPFAKFIKALKHIDSSASKDFWTSDLRDLSGSRPIVSEAGLRQTSAQRTKTYTVTLPTAGLYEPSVLAVGAWSLVLSHLSKSSKVLFGNVLSGRAFDMTGIQEVCGPTLATVPWAVDIPRDATVRDFLDKLQNKRMQILPYEQTGLTEYRALNGSAAFDTLLSIRYSSETQHPPEQRSVRPEPVDSNEMRHPCSIFLEVDIHGRLCTIKSSYDERYVDASGLSVTMDGFVKAMEQLADKLDSGFQSLKESLGLPSSIGVAGSADQTGSKDADTLHEDEQHGPRLDNQTLQKLHRLVADTVGINNVQSDTTLSQLGMDSLKTVVLSRQINKNFKISVPLAEIAGPSRSISSIERSVARAQNASDIPVRSRGLEIDLLKAAKRYMASIVNAEQPSTESPDGAVPQDETSAILLTGATGYLGVEILRQLLREAVDQVILLVRCDSPSSGLDRISRSAQTAKWSSEELKGLDRVRVWPSDLSQERLGLGDEHWRQLSSSPSSHKLKAIIHNGAKVDFLQSYQDLELINVRATAILLNCHLRMSHHPSFVLVTGGRPCPVTPDDMTETAKALAAAGGYAQSKLVSEVLVHETKNLYEKRGQAVHMSIVHPGAIVGSTSTGVANADDFVWRYVAASVQMGQYVPAVPVKREWINLTPVDHVARAVVSEALRDSNLTQSSVERCLIRMGLPISQFWRVVVETLKGHDTHLEPVSEWEWLAELESDLADDDHCHPLFTLSQLMLEGKLKGIGGQGPVTRPKTDLRPDTEHIEAALHSNVEYLLSTGFFSDYGSFDGGFARTKG